MEPIKAERHRDTDSNYFKMKKIFLLLPGFWLLVAGCGKSDDDRGGEDMFDRGAILLNMADKLIVPSYEDFLTRAGTMDEDLQAFADAPSAVSLEQARESWLQAYLAWQQVALWDIGPAMQEGLLSSCNTYPADTEAIAGNISDGEYNLASPDSKAEQGFPAVEFLLYGDEAADEDILAAFADQNRKNYLKALSGRIVSLTGEVVDTWKSSYRDTFVSAPGLDRGSSLGELFNNTFLPYLEKHNREAKFGIPGGQRTGEPLPGHVEGLYSRKYSKQLAYRAWEAYKKAWTGSAFSGGASGASVMDYVRFVDGRNGTNLAGTLMERLDQAGGLIDELPADFYELASAGEGAASLREVWDAYQQCVVTIKSDIASALSVTISYVDTDGD